jgi:hypothetical protein
MSVESEDDTVERLPMRRVDFGGGDVRVSVDPRHDPDVQKRIRTQALAIVGVSFVVLALAFAVPIVVHLFRLSLP